MLITFFAVVYRSRGFGANLVRKAKGMMGRRVSHLIDLLCSSVCYTIVNKKILN